jgi:glycine cleavage system aminomethyltransferase T
MPELTTNLYFGPWYRRSPFFEATRRAGCKAYDIYNKMYLPAEYDDAAVEYRALDEAVTLWDVGVERTVQVSGPDADRLIDMVTCRDLTKCAVKQGKYMLVTAPDGGIVNDPVLLHVDDGVWWMQLADSDAGLYTLGVLSQTGLEAEVSYPDVHPVQVQGPLSGRTLAKLVGEAIYDIRYYWCERFAIRDIPVLISRTGWSAVPGFEVNLLDGSRGDELWDAILDAGEEFGIRPIAPNEARRIEAGIFNYGSDITLADTPFHVMGLERLVEEQEGDYIGKSALERIRHEGVDRKLVGIELSAGAPLEGITRTWPAFHAGREVGRVTAAVWSPGLARNIGYVRVPIDLAAPGTHIDVDSEHGHMDGTTAAIPFVDPRKERPARPLRAVAD